MGSLYQDRVKNNIFVVIEQFINNPTPESAQKIKHLSHQLTVSAGLEISVRSGKRIEQISADEYYPILLKHIAILAEEAENYSMRMIIHVKTNRSSTLNDPSFIFRLSKSQQEKILKLKNDLLYQTELFPHGLIAAYNGYIERYNSCYSYCSGVEAQAYDHNALLYAKAMELQLDGEQQLAYILTKACREIKDLLYENKSGANCQKNTAYFNQFATP